MKFQELQLRLLKIDKDELIKNLGYTNADNFEKAIFGATNAKSLAYVLYNGYFDELYSSKLFVLKLAEILELDLASEPKEAKVYNDELKKYENMYIYIGANFKCTAQSIFVLAFLQGTRYVKIPDKSVFCFKGLKEYLKIVSDIVRDSYKKSLFYIYLAMLLAISFICWEKITFLTQAVNLWIKKSTNKSLRLDFKERNIGKFGCQ